MINSKKLLGYFIILALILGSLELTSRAFLALRYSSTFFHPSRIIYNYYPMVEAIKTNYQNDELPKVLVLSSSALTPEWGNFAKHFEEYLNNKKTTWQVYNAAGVGFSSRDNLNTLKLLEDLHFDQVIFYNGINDVRLNNCPPELFDDQYRHISWSNETYTILKHNEMDIFTLPFFLDYQYQLLKAKYCSDCFIAKNYHEQEAWQDYGDNFQSLASFRKNVEAVIASKSPETILHLVSFATYIPEDYTFEQFAEHQLDYNFHENSREVEVWGYPKNVEAYMLNANQELESLEDPSAEVYFHDIRPELKQANYFADVCHFSAPGINELARLMSDSVLLK